MKHNTYSALRLIAGLLTIVIVVVQQYIPDRRLTILPNPNYPQSIYHPANATTAEASVWVDENEHHWRCTVASGHDFSCGYSLSLSEDHVHGLDLEEYDGIKLDMAYTGEAPRIRLYMRHYDPEQVSGDSVQSAKFLSTIIRTRDLDEIAQVKLSEFSVAEWWIKEFDIPREHAAPEFSNIITIGFDFVNDGQHELKIERIELTGSWIQRESLYLAIIIFWMALILWEGVHRFYRIYRESRDAHQKITKLETDYDLLEMQKSEYETLSTTDPLTGVLNRAGLQRMIDRLFDLKQEKTKVGILMFDIDHFKMVNDTYGHDCGDQILKELAQLISQNIRQQDSFARWGGEEFVLLCVQITEEQLLALAEKLRVMIAEHRFATEEAQHITVSVGATLVTLDDKFGNALKRADVAMYDAKHNGRNRVAYKPA